MFSGYIYKTINNNNNNNNNEIIKKLNYEIRSFVVFQCIVVYFWDEGKRRWRRNAIKKF